MFDLPNNDGEKKRSECNRRWCEPANRKPIVIELSRHRPYNLSKSFGAVIKVSEQEPKRGVTPPFVKNCTLRPEITRGIGVIVGVGNFHSQEVPLI
jgi:hypothetical protein